MQRNAKSFARFLDNIEEDLRCIANKFRCEVQSIAMPEIYWQLAITTVHQPAALRTTWRYPTQ